MKFKKKLKKKKKKMAKNDGKRNETSSFKKSQTLKSFSLRKFYEIKFLLYDKYRISVVAERNKENACSFKRIKLMSVLIYSMHAKMK